MGLPLLTGGAVRYRLYTAWGLSGTEIAGVVAFNSITLWLGLGAMAVLGGRPAPAELAAIMGIRPSTIVAFAVLVLALLLAYPALPLVLRWSAHASRLLELHPASPHDRCHPDRHGGGRLGAGGHVPVGAAAARGRGRLPGLRLPVQRCQRDRDHQPRTRAELACSRRC